MFRREPDPLVQRLKEWGEVTEIWSKIFIRIGFTLLGVLNGGSLVKILETALA